MTRDHQHAWHVAINRFHWPEGQAMKPEHRKWMYEAKTMSQEVPRLALLFKMARTGELPKVHRQCSHAEAEPIPENHLTCCLGVECAECPELMALDAMAAPPEAIDEAKAWTCATHIAFKGGDWAAEGYLLTVDDRMYWDRVYSHLAMPHDPDEPEAEAITGGSGR